MGAQSRGVWMWTRAVSLLDEAERRHRRFFELFVSPTRQPTWEPPVDLFVHDDELHVVVAMPATRAETVSIELFPGALLVRAESRLPLHGERVRILRLEIPYGHIERRIELPAGRLEVHSQRLIDGCLHVHLVPGEPK